MRRHISGAFCCNAPLNTSVPIFISTQACIPNAFVSMPRFNNWREVNKAKNTLPAFLGQFLSDPGKPGVRSLSPDVTNLTDVTLADEDTNPIMTDNANRAFQGNVAMCM